jgi:hypothetical protein
LLTTYVSTIVSCSAHNPLHKDSIYTEIISIQPVLGKKMVIFTFDLYNPDDKATYPGYDMMVRTTPLYHRITMDPRARPFNKSCLFSGHCPNKFDSSDRDSAVLPRAPALCVRSQDHSELPRTTSR